MTSGEGSPINLAAALMMLWILLALPTGLILLIWGNVEFNRAYKATQRYAEMNGWLPISRTSWSARKRNQVILSVAQAFQRQTFILNIQIDGETITVDEFETSLWALQFGDWLWQELLQTRTDTTKAEIDMIRAEWEASRAIVPYNPGSVERSG